MIKTPIGRTILHFEVEENFKKIFYYFHHKLLFTAKLKRILGQNIEYFLMIKC